MASSYVWQGGGLKAQACASGPLIGPVIGIDPGSRKCGYGIVSASGGYLASGTIVLSPDAPLYVRLRELYEGLSGVIEEHSPKVAAVERIFFSKGAKSALVLGEARGVALLSVSIRGLDVCEYTASEIKKAVTGYGRAEKTQVQQMVKQVLGLKHGLSPDGADALAVALCHQQMARFEVTTGK